MTAELFTASAEAATGPLCRAGASVGERIEAAVEASWAAAGCNTDLGIVLACAPIACAAEREPAARTPDSLRAATERVLARLDLADARAGFRAIARANPGGLGDAPREDVRQPPTVDLRTAMALAARRDRIALQYRDGYAEVFEAACRALRRRPGLHGEPPGAPVGDVAIEAVQRMYLHLLGSAPDSHIVRNHGDAVAHSVMTAAQGWLVRARLGGPIDADPEFAEWDETLKAQGINPGTTADLTVAVLFVANLCARWHGS